MDSVQTSRVLLVEDDEDIAFLISSSIRKSEIEVTTVYTGDDALPLLREQAFDLVLSDIAMPGMSGLRLLKRVQALGFAIPFVFITGYGNSETMIEAVRLGAIDFLCKPVAESELMATVQRALAIGHRQKEIDALIEKLAQGAAPETSALLNDLQRQIGLLRVLGTQEKSFRSA